MYGDNMRFENAHFGAMDFGSYGIGASVSPIGSQLMTTNTAMNWGVQNLEVNLGTQMSFQQAGHLSQLGKIEREELIRLAKLNKVNLSVHAPHFCAAGGQGNVASESARLRGIQEFKHVLDFADQIGTGMNKKHVPVVIHAVEGIPGNPMPEKTMHVINRESGEIVPLEAKEVAYPASFFERNNLQKGVDYHELGGGKYNLLPQGRLKVVNKQMVENLNHQLSNVAYSMDLHKSHLMRAGLNLAAIEKSPHAVESQLLKEGRKDLLDNLKMYSHAVNQRKEIEEQVHHLKTRYSDEKGNLSIYQNPDDFAKEKMTKTFVELGMKSYEKPSKPMIVIENFYPEHALSDPNKLADSIEHVRKKFADELVRKKGLSRSAAIRESKEIIGMNLDIGHLNLFKKYTNPNTGKPYSDKEILEWVRQARPFLKHVHITDNYGDMDAHLPVGWGNTPIKEVMNVLKKEGFQGRAILETFGGIQYGGGHFGVAQSMYSFGAPVVPGGPGWGSASQSYFDAGYAFTTGPILPDINFQTYGVGFSGLPYATGAQIGGQKPGGQFSGTPMS